MPGTREAIVSVDWFRDEFGFREFSYADTRDQLEFKGGVLTSKANGKEFYVGEFEVQTLDALQAKCETAVAQASPEFWSAGSLNFTNIVGETRALHLDPENAGAVFQVASLFNCLETSQTGCGPEEGVTTYALRGEQGAAAAVACPGAIAFRNFFVNGRGQARGKELNCLKELGAMVNNNEEQYWVLRKGFCIPIVPGKLANLSQKLATDSVFHRKVMQKVGVGIHWDTEVSGGHHHVAQVFCSTLPASLLKQRPAADWAGFSSMLLEAAFEAVFNVAAYIAASKGHRVKVFLTALGGGSLGNRRSWIITALSRALLTSERRPLDVMLVHYASIPHDFKMLEEGRDVGSPTATESMVSTVSSPCSPLQFPMTPSPKSAMALSPNHRLLQATNKEEAEKIAGAFSLFDTNGDGTIDRKEFQKILQIINKEVFTLNACNILFKEADCNGDGHIHYMEFADWICAEDDEIVQSILSGCHTSNAALESASRMDDES